MAPTAKRRRVASSSRTNSSDTISIPKLLDGKYFQIVSRDGIQVKATCMQCGKMRSGQTKSTGNFMEHIRKDHPCLIDVIELYRQNTDMNVDEPQDRKRAHKTLPAMFKPFTYDDVSIFRNLSIYFVI